ncbi:MAG: 3-isopropylmalate dehydratase small subunit [Thermodesulfobacteriota bacterium]
MKFRGRVWKFGNDVNTDEIIPARFLSLADTSELGQHVMEGIDPAFRSKVKPGDIIVAGKNFGCGSSREHAPVAIRAAGVACVIAKSFARIFFRNAFNMGLLILEAPDATDAITEGEVLDVDTDQGLIRNIATGGEFRVSPVPPFMGELLRDGGLIAHLKKRSLERSPASASNKQPGKSPR